MKSVTAATLAAALVAVALIPAGSALAADKPAKPAAKPAPAPTPAPTPTPTPTPTSDGPTSSVPVNTTVLDHAEHSAKLAQADFDAFVAAKKAEFEQGEAYLAAKKSVDDATQALETIAAPVREKIKAADPAYAQALTEIVAARAKLDEAVLARKPDDIAFRRSDVQYFQSIITKAQTPVFSRDEAIQAAQSKLDAAKEKYAAMEKRFNDALTADQDYRALARALTNAQARLAMAKSAAARP